MIQNYLDFARWVWNLPEGDRILLDEMPLGRNGKPATAAKMRAWCWNVNERAGGKPYLAMITPSPESGGRWVLRRYEGWDIAIQMVLALKDEPLVRIFERIDPENPFYTDKLTYGSVRMQVVMYNQDKPRERRLKAIRCGNAVRVVSVLDRNEISQRRAWLEQMPTLTPEGIPVPADRVQYARLVASDWNRRHEDKVSVVTRDGTSYLVPQTEAVNGKALKEAAMRDGWAAGPGRGLKSDKDVVVKVYPGNTVAYFRRDALMGVRIAAYEAKLAGAEVVSVLDAARSIY